MNTNRLPLLALAAALLAPAALHAQFSQPVRDVENPAQNVFVATGFSQVTNNFVATVMPVQDIPAGKRLTVEALTIRCRVPNEASIITALIRTRVRTSPISSPKEAWFYVHMVKQGEPGNNFTWWVGSLAGRVFTEGDATFPPSVEVTRSPANTGDFSCGYSLHGGLTNLP